MAASVVQAASGKEEKGRELEPYEKEMEHAKVCHV